MLFPFYSVEQHCFSCREVGMNCDYVCKAETEEEIMKTAAEEHAMKDHGYKVDDLMTPELRSKIRSHIEILILLLSSYF